MPSAPPLSSSAEAIIITSRSSVAPERLSAVITARFTAVMTIGDQLCEAITVHEDVTRAQAEERSCALLEKVGIRDSRKKLSQYPHQFSGGMLEELGKDYVRTARAKGLPESRVIGVHARKNALIPVITLASLQFVRLLGGVVVTETVFDFPGIGRWGVLSAQQLDIAGVLGFSLVTSILFVAGNLLSDVMYAVVDPRIRLK